MYAMAIKTEPGRKTFSGAGKPKALVPYREPNGQPQRLLKTESIAEVVSIAEAQPHRRKSESPRSADLGTPVGRLLHARKMLSLKGPRSPEAAYFTDAARRYGDAWAGMRWAMQSRRPWANVGWRPEKVFESPEAEIAQAEEYEKRWADIQRAFRDTLDGRGERIGPRCRSALQALIIDSQQEDWQPPQFIVYYGEIGLGVLVKFFRLGE